jgi:autotransporter-associated beta strand protein
MTNTGGTLNIPAITNNGTLTLDRSDALSLTGTLSGSGTTRVLGGTAVSLDNGGAWSGGEIYILSNGLVRFNGGTGNGAASLNLNGGVVDVNGQFLPANSWANLIPRMSGAKLVNSSTSSAAIGSGNNTLWLYTASLEIETVGDLQIDSVIHSTLAPTATGITKTGTGKLTLTAANTYTGGTTVSDGELVIAQANFTANITPSAISVTLSNTPSGGDTFQLVPGPLAGSYGAPIVSNLGAGQSASFDASTGILSITQSSTGPSFADAYPGNTMTDIASNGLTYLLNYAFGGSSTPATSLPFQDTSDPAKLSLVAYVRTNNAVGILTVVGEKGDSLSNFDTANPILGEVATDQSDAPAGTQKRVFSVPHDGDRLFLRLKATLQ